MKQPDPDGTRKAALARLLDDESEVVRRAVMAELERMGEAGATFLQGLADGTNRLLASHARAVLQEMGREDTVAGFTQFIQSFRYELETGCLLLERAVNPHLDSAEVCLFLDRLAARCREISVMPASMMERCKVLNRVLFHEAGFRGDVENFYDPSNSFLSQVVRRRRGIPISLSILYVLIGQRCNLPLEPVSVPGRFMVGCFSGSEVFYIDAFERGRFRTAAEVRRMILRNYGSDPGPHMAPSSIGEVLCRCCRNLVNQFAAQKNERMIRIFSEFVHEFESTYRRESSH